MSLNIKKSRIAVLAVFMLFLTLVPVAYPAFVGSVLRSFGVSITIFNQAPVIKFNNATFSVDPVEGTITKILLSFNATDPDGVTQINASKIRVNLTLGDSIWRTNITEAGPSTCLNHTEGNNVVINCTVVMYYYDNASANWAINVTIMDIMDATSRNGTTFTYNELSALSLPQSFVNFSTVTIGEQNVPSYPHVILNNTGNDDFDQINISAMPLIGTSNGAESIPVTNFYANSTNGTAGAGRQLQSTAVTLPDNSGSGNLNLIHGHTSAFGPNSDKGNLSLFFWVDVPSSGLSAQAYNGTWNITVIDNP